MSEAAVLALLGWLLLAFPCEALDKVSLQLKWRHQFQFAGYYAALEQGYYRDAGLDVEIREGGPDVDVRKAVQEGTADFGVCTTSVLLAKPDPALVVLAVIFQHSPAVLIVPRRTGIGTLRELKGRPLMDTPGSDEVAAMLKRADVDYAKLPRVSNYGDPRDLADGKADAMVGYSTNEPFVLGQLGVPYRMFLPSASGLDFYGDNLCTSAAQIKANPRRVAAFLAASLKGWEYALEYDERVVDLILKRYSTAKSRDALLFEAAQSESLIEADRIPIGSQTVQRWQSIADAYRELGMLADATLPDTLIYRADGWSFAMLVRQLAWAMAGAIGLALLWLSYRRINNRLELASNKPRLGAIMAGLFVCFTIPILLFILAFNYYRNSETMGAMLRQAVAQTSSGAIENVQDMIDGVAGAVHIVAEISSVDPGFFRTERSREILFRALISAAEIDAAFLSFEDGYHRVVTRIDANRRRSDPRIPAEANWHSSFIDDYSAGDKRARHRTFFDVWDHAVGGYDIATAIDYRSIAAYPAAKATRGLAVSDPEINADTGHPIINIRQPIFREGEFIGAAGATITLDVLSQFLARHRASPNSTTIIAELSDGKIIAESNQHEGVVMVDGKLQVARLETIADADVREAWRLHKQADRDDFTFVSPRNGKEISASFIRFTESYGRPWQAVVLTPTDDFIGSLKATNREVVLFIAVLSAIELLLIHWLSLRLSRPLESVVRDLKAVEGLSFEPMPTRSSKVREIAQLQSTAALLRNSLKSFASFAPVEVVRDLIRSGIPLSLGVEKRSMTIMFTDLENFSSHSEQTNPDELLTWMSVYFEEVSQAIHSEQGTVDKFIGDGVMAFWGAPEIQPDHALRACRGAVRAVRRLEQVNRSWGAEGLPPFRVRIGLNSAAVLVGNVGSAARFSYTVMGDGVNVAARLEGMNKEFGTSICISDSVFDAVKPHVLARPLRRLRVKGRQQEFMAYELLGIRDSDDPELAIRADDEKLCELTSLASTHLTAGRIEQASQAYRTVLEHCPGDRFARTMLEVMPVPEVG